MISNYKLEIRKLDIPNQPIRFRCVFQDWGERDVNDGKGLEYNGTSVQHFALENEVISELLKNTALTISDRENRKLNVIPCQIQP